MEFSSTEKYWEHKCAATDTKYESSLASLMNAINRNLATRNRPKVNYSSPCGHKMILSYLRSVFLAEFFPFPLSTFADQQKRKMNASISDAEAPFSHLLRSRFHIKLVIAYDPARYGSHSGGPCYINEIC